ncbi:MAG: TonB-dependent receptor plug domain-containing protein [Glaciecola sp.]
MQSVPDNAKLETITVSGKRPNKPVQDIAAQVDVISAEDINRLKLYNSYDLANSLANIDMRAASPLNSSISIRGVGARNWHINANQGVQLALDDSNILGTYGSKLMLFDIQ